MSQPVELPPVQDVVLDDATVAQLFFNLGQAAELVGVGVKPLGGRRAAAADELSLAEAHQALLGRAVAAVQLRYRFAGEEWWDTLMPTPGGTRLIRISHTRALATPSRSMEPAPEGTR